MKTTSTERQRIHEQTIRNYLRLRAYYARKQARRECRPGAGG